MRRVWVSERLIQVAGGGSGACSLEHMGVVGRGGGRAACEMRAGGRAASRMETKVGRNDLAAAATDDHEDD